MSSTATRRGPSVMARAAYQRVEQGFSHESVFERDLPHNSGQGFCTSSTACTAPEFVGQVEPARRQNRDAHLRQPALPDLAFEIGQTRVLGTFQTDRQNHRSGLVGNHARPFVDLHQGAGRGDPAFGENDRLAAALDEPDHRFNRRGAERVHLELVNERQERFEIPAARRIDIYREGRRLGQEEIQQGAVDQ